MEAVVGELQKCRGTQFDPNLVDLVVNSVVIRRVMAEISRASDGGEKAVPREGGSSESVGEQGATRRARRSWLRRLEFRLAYQAVKFDGQRPLVSS